MIAMACLAGLLMGSAGDRAASLERERAQVEERLAFHQATLELLHEQKISLLELLDLYQGMARDAQARAAFLDRQMAGLRQRSRLADVEQSVAVELLQMQVKRLSPRLLGLYRLTRRTPLDVLLPARDFAALVWRTRAYSALMQRDLELLRETRRVADFERRTYADLEAMKGILGAQLVEARADAQEVKEQRADLDDALTLIQAEASHSSRVVKELKVAEDQLSRVLAELKESPTVSGFGALRAKLPLPVEGVVEAGFGRVVNPRFNTVTVQKGWDIRAPLGAPVRAVADGQVVYAATLRGYGNLLILDHGGGFHTLMAHLAGFTRKVGENVLAGDVVGQVGDTGSLKGPYLYFEVRERGLAEDPADWVAEKAGRAAAARP